MSAVRQQENVLLQASTGAGKTIMFSALIQDFLTRYAGRMRIVVLAHRETLVRQAYDKLLQVWPEGALQIGIACSSVSKNTDLDRPVIIGSVQTLSKRLDYMPEVNMLIVDEVHRMPPRAEKGKAFSQYEALINALRQVYPQMRLFGVTATPYRLNWGYIYGDKKTRDPERNWFQNLTWSIGIDTLQEEGFLCPLVPLGIDAPDLDNVNVNGDYVLDELSEEMSKSIHLESAVQALEKYGQDRKHVVVFAVTIEHAQMLQDVFQAHGHSTGIVHSKLSHADVLASLKMFNEGRVRCMINVGMLTEGWDCPCADCIILCRPTKSTALYVQMVGRGLRIAEGKEDCLLLDMAGCWKEHGNPRHPIVRLGRRPKDTIDCPECGFVNDARRILCESCNALLRPGNSEEDECACPHCGTLITNRTIICPNCGGECKKVEHKLQDLHRLDADENTDEIRAELVGTPNANFDFVSRKGARMLKVVLNCQPEGQWWPITINDFWDIEGNASLWGQQKAARRWESLSGQSAPSSLAEASSRWGEVIFPESLTIRKKDGWWNVVRYS